MILSPGQELDAIVAEKVMGKVLCVCTDETRQACREKIAEEFVKTNPTMTGFVRVADAANFPKFGSDGNCNYCGKHYVAAKRYSDSIAAAWEVVEKAEITNITKLVGGWTAENDGIDLCETAPHAICLAALRAVGAM